MKQFASTYVLAVKLGLKIKLAHSGQKMSRKVFLEALWGHFAAQGLQGIHEGTLLSEQAADEGLETNSWTVDSGEAPRERDWVADQASTQAELYFATRAQAQSALKELTSWGILGGKIREQKHQDWDARWKASFKGAKVPPHWHILPPWEKAPKGSRAQIVRINPGAGFGTGTHETTRLCLKVLGALKHRPARTLDFGSGSGILSIAAHKLGSRVQGVEIDPLAIDNANENARLNRIKKIAFVRTLKELKGKQEDGYDCVIANILKPVLLEFCGKLVPRLKPDGQLILSGLVENDLPAVIKAYQAALDQKFKKQLALAHAPAPKVLALHEWRALHWNLAQQK